MDPIKSFSGGNRFLSNFFIEPDGTHVEGEFQAAKTPSMQAKLMIWAASPREAKRLGRSVDMRQDWDYVRVDIMSDFVLRKFYDHSELRTKLLATRQSPLIEGNTWHDNFWGDCFCGRESCQIPGNNHLGRILQNVRTVLL